MPGSAVGALDSPRSPPLPWSSLDVTTYNGLKITGGTMARILGFLVRILRRSIEPGAYAVDPARFRPTLGEEHAQRVLRGDM